MKKTFIFFLIFFTAQNFFSQQITSPDGKLQLNIKLTEQNELVYNLLRNDKQIIKDSQLGIDLNDQPDFLDGFIIDTIVTSKFSEEWKPVWGEVNKILNNYNQMKVTVVQPKELRKMFVTFRLFNDGLGIR